MKIKYVAFLVITFFIGNYSMADKMIVDEARMQKNIDLLRGLIFSQKTLLALTQKGLTREVSYKIVQKAAMKVWDNDDATFYDTLKEDPIIQDHFTDEELNEIFNKDSYLKNINYIWDKIF